MYPKLHFGGAAILPATLDIHANAIADHLFQMGVRPGEVVALMLRNEPAMFEIILACQLAGCYFCTINWHFKEEETRHVLLDSGAKILFLHHDLANQIGSALHCKDLVIIDVPPPAALARQVQPPSDIPSSPIGRPYGSMLRPIPGLSRPPADARGAMPYTSGSTGRPKGVLRLFTGADRTAQALAARRALGQTVFGIDSSSIALLPAPMYHSAPLSYALFCAAEQATLYLESKFDPVRTLELIQEQRITHAYLVPTMYQRLLRIPVEVRQRYDISSLQFVASTGSPCAPETKRAMIDWFGPVINEAYASSETGYITFIDSADSLRKPGSAGKPVLSARVRIIGERGQEMPTGEVGLIYAQQPAYPDFTYVNNPDSRAQMEQDGLVTLGDMGYLDDEGYLYVSDRKNDMVISGGVNIYPAEIEAVLNEMEGILDCAVFGIPDPEFGEALAAAIELRPGQTLTEDAILEYLDRRLAKYKLPRIIRFHESLPREETGKIFKRHLRAPYWAASGRLI